MLDRLRLRKTATQTTPTFDDWLPEVTPEFDWNWRHLKEVRKHLAEVTAGTCRKLILSLPPQHGKSEGLTVRYPIWRMECNPKLRVAVGAYNQTHANRFSRKSRRIARVRLPLSDERKSANEWETEAGGSYVAVGVGAGITGLPVDLLIIDDPVKNREEADSEAHRERVWEWFMDDLTTRLQEGAPCILVMTRWHEADLAGMILASEDGPNWKHICLPAIAEENDQLGRAVGEALCPERFSLEALQEKHRILGEGFEGLYQQRPVPRGGLFFRRDWFPPPILCVPDGKKLRRVRYWDLAATREDTSAWTAGVLLATDGQFYYVEHVVRVRENPGDRNEVIRKTAEQDACLPGYERTWFEAAPGLGVEISQSLIRSMAGLPVRADEIGTRSKESRAEPFADAARGGLVKLIAGRWNAAWLNEVASFPRGAYKDQVDSTAGAFNKLARPGIVWA